MTDAAHPGRALRLPAALPAIPASAARKLRVVWMVLAAVVLAVQLAGLLYVLFDAYRVKPAMRAVGFTTEFNDADQVVVIPLRSDVRGAGVVAGAQVRDIAGTRFGAEATHLSLGRALLAVPGDVVPISFRNPDGRVVTLRISRSSRARLLTPTSPLPLDLRMGVRLAFTLLCSVVLLSASLLLLLRRGGDAEAVLFGLGFLLIATVVDPPLVMWLGVGAGWVIDAMTGVWWCLLAVALAAFPDGRFTPPVLRWMLVAAPMIGLVLAFDVLGDVGSLAIGVGVPLLLLAGQVVQYRALEPGPKRQQIKWAAFGFATGFALAGVSLGMSLVDTDGWSPLADAVWALAVVCLFNLAFAVLPLGLLVALARYRLWDVDRVITRSAAVAALTGLIVLLWALLSDVTKQVIAAVLGQEHASLAVAIGAIAAAGVFTPTQQMVLRWSERRFNPTRVDLKRLPERLKAWQAQCTAPEIAMRALDVAIRALHAPAGAVLARTPTGTPGRMTVLASRGFGDLDQAGRLDPDRADAGTFVLPLEDEDGLAGWLMLLPREDGSRFPRLDLTALRALSAPLSRALRPPRAEGEEDSAVLSLLDKMHERLARLERSPTSRA